MFQNSKYYYFIYGATIILLVLSIWFGVKFLVNLRKEKTQVSAPIAANVGGAATDDSELIARVGKHLVLPLEQPKVVTISNVEDLRRQQPFFLQAKNGDKLLVYSSRVILYNPDLDKIVDVAQIRVDVTPTP